MSQLLADTEAARKRRKTIALALAAAALLLLIVTLVWWRNLPEEDGTVISGAVAPVPMSAADIFAVYQDDPTLARLSNRPIAIDADLAAAPASGAVILLRTPDPLLSLAAQVDPRDAVKLSGLEAGARVSLQCVGVDPGVRAPLLKSCTLQ